MRESVFDSGRFKITSIVVRDLTLDGALLDCNLPSPFEAAGAGSAPGGPAAPPAAVEISDLPGDHQKAITHAADIVVGIADDCGHNLVDVIAAMERYIVEETKVGDAATWDEGVPGGVNGYTLVDGRLTRYP